MARNGCAALRCATLPRRVELVNTALQFQKQLLQSITYTPSPASSCCERWNLGVFSQKTLHNSSSFFSTKVSLQSCVGAAATHGTRTPAGSYFIDGQWPSIVIPFALWLECDGTRRSVVWRRAQAPQSATGSSKNQQHRGHCQQIAQMQNDTSAMLRVVYVELSGVQVRPLARKCKFSIDDACSDLLSRLIPSVAAWLHPPRKSATVQARRLRKRGRRALLHDRTR